MLVHGGRLVDGDDGLCGRWSIAERTVGPNGVVVPALLPNEDLGPAEREADLAVQEFGLR